MYPGSASKLSAYSCIRREAPSYSTGRRYYCYSSSCIALDSTPPTSLFSLSHPEPDGALPLSSLLFVSSIHVENPLKVLRSAPTRLFSSALFSSFLFYFVLSVLFFLLVCSARVASSRFILIAAQHSTQHETSVAGSGLEAEDEDICLTLSHFDTRDESSRFELVESRLDETRPVTAL